MCVFLLWSQCPSRCSFHMPNLCVCMSWLMSLFKCSSLLSVGSFALIMSPSFICALMFSGSRGLLGLILPFGMHVSHNFPTFFLSTSVTTSTCSMSHGFPTHCMETHCSFLIDRKSFCLLFLSSLDVTILFLSLKPSISHNSFSLTLLTPTTLLSSPFAITPTLLAPFFL